jgi:hypothetical protein
MRGNVYRVLGLWLMLPFACWAQGQQKNPAWFNQPQFFLSEYPYQLPFQSPLSALPLTGQLWGAYILDNTFPDSQLQMLVDSWHNQGGIYFFVEDLYAHNSIVPGWDSFRMRNLAGAYIDVGGFYAPQNIPLYSLSSPVFQQALLAGALHAVDVGADGMTFDNSALQMDIMLGAPDQSGSFDSVTMAAFQAYLQHNFTASQLQSQFGISDIGSVALSADAWNDAVDMCSVIVALIAVGLFVIFFGLRVVRETALQLMDTMPEGARMDEIRKVAMRVPWGSKNVSREKPASATTSTCTWKSTPTSPCATPTASRPP